MRASRGEGDFVVRLPTGSLSVDRCSMEGRGLDARGGFSLLQSLTILTSGWFLSREGGIKWSGCDWLGGLVRVGRGRALSRDGNGRQIPGQHVNAGRYITPCTLDLPRLQGKARPE